MGHLTCHRRVHRRRRCLLDKVFLHHLPVFYKNCHPTVTWNEAGLIKTNYAFAGRTRTVCLKVRFGAVQDFIRESNLSARKAGQNRCPALCKTLVAKCVLVCLPKSFVFQGSGNAKGHVKWHITEHVKGQLSVNIHTWLPFVCVTNAFSPPRPSHSHVCES